MVGSRQDFLRVWFGAKETDFVCACMCVCVCVCSELLMSLNTKVHMIQ